MFKISPSTFSGDGKTIVYNYEASRDISKYFSKKESFFAAYDKIVSGVPESIVVIPLLANIMPIAWFAGFDVYVDELDATFYQSLIELKAEFSKHFSNIKNEGKLHVNRLVQNTFTQNHSALLFSGGLDSFESLTRNIAADPFLVSIHGADIEISDTKRWDDFVRFNKEEPIVNDSKLCYVTSNLRTFYTYEVDLLVEINWWGKIQHGMALIGLIAPLSYLNGITTIMIASSNTGEVSFGWGSTSETDEKVKWANTKVIHDGFHLRRTDKIQNIVDFAKKTGEHVKLRVCYSEFRKGYNCSECAKCQRTMLGIVLSGENPNDYGFNVGKNFYDLILKNFGENAIMTTGVAYEWKCLQEKARESQNPYVISDKISEMNNINTFAALPLDEIINKNAAKGQGIKKAKYILMAKFPKLFKVYLNIRRKI
ncbi:hypothetical protein FNO01nite_10460 [Flavobacterium noncentrifugens]|uniref:7-cyano-7-deazaguanine synthase (Queuosine biosynthesis) n=1 Tax=Flavobacterium noncentrifugens TaxID=1128970 RepID=A0A1G8V778_9FLAO|nr:hypothetical protein [Flavobacterium noncentrifugens]GEP50374.1 hypothetical protein FNO01nite_10460 [Flavobacterium noncentrifugens]SDJ61996.1 hypothetical protein SAMN04487935_1218 [Flavobacterium noncentrifugens]